MNKSFVYFILHSRNLEIRVGFTGPDDGNFKRLKQHASYGFSGVTAIVPGTIEDETSTHRLFEKFKLEPSIYEATGDLVEYVEALLALGRAAPSVDEAPTWPMLPFDLWKFGSGALCYIDLDGQPSLFRAAPVRDRLEYAHQQAVLQSRGDEWYTPADLLDRARAVMGEIDLDPASSPIANRTVKARTFYTKAMNGLNLVLPWHGSIWLNPPYGRGPESASMFIERLVTEWSEGHITQAIVCLNLNSMSSEWFRPLLDASSVHAIIYGRTSFIPPTGITESSPTKGTVLVYLGPHTDRFAESYSDVGAVFGRHVFQRSGDALAVEVRTPLPLEFSA